MASIACCRCCWAWRSTTRPVPGAARRRWHVLAIATAALATRVGFLVLLLSPVPMVRGFGALLIVGVAVALVLALTAGTAALTLAARRRARRRGARSLRGAGARRRGARRRRRGRSRRGSAPRPASTLAARRCALSSPRATPARARRRGRARHLRLGARRPDRRSCPTCRGSCRRTSPRCATSTPCSATPASPARSTCSSGARPHRSEGDRVDARLPERILLRHGYDPAKGCSGGRAVPGAVAARPVPHAELSATREQVRALLDAVPAVLLAGRDHARPAGRMLAFGLRLRSLEAQQEVIEEMRARLNPPAGCGRRSPGCPCSPPTPTMR